MHPGWPTPSATIVPLGWIREEISKGIKGVPVKEEGSEELGEVERKRHEPMNAYFLPSQAAFPVLINTQRIPSKGQV